MSDQTPTPRTWAGDLGTEDVRNSLKRQYIPIPLHASGPTVANHTTVGLAWGADSNTTGIPMFRRNVLVEKIFMTGYKWTTVNAKTTLLSVRLMRGGVSTVASFVMTNSTTLAQRWHAWSTAARLPNLTSTSKLSLVVDTRNGMSQMSAVLVVRQRAD